MMVSNAKKVAGNIYCDTIPRTVSITGGRNSLMERLKLKFANYAVLPINSKCITFANLKT